MTGILLTLLTLIAALSNPTQGFADDRIWLKGAMINGKFVKLCFDSGCDNNVITPLAVKHLGLKVNADMTNQFPLGVVAGITDHCNLTINGVQVQTAFMVVNFPDYVDPEIDGLIGWCPSQNVVRIDAFALEVDFFAKVPRRSGDWIQFSVITNSGSLELGVPHNDHTSGIISIDTGSERGMDLPTGEWHRWKEAHPHSPITLRTYYTVTDGVVVREEAWADQVCIGPLVLTSIPISEEAPSTATRLGKKNDGILGLAALKRLDLVIDGRNSVAYLRPKTTRPPAYPHNRLGAAFGPTTTHPNEAVAVVVTGSPAYEAGVRNGDVLLQVNEIPVVGWSDDWNGCFGKAAGTTLYLTLKRDGKVFKTEATLRQIIPSNAIIH
jgi:hypothetical protein